MFFATCWFRSKKKDLKHLSVYKSVFWIKSIFDHEEFHIKNETGLVSKEDFNVTIKLVCVTLLM